MSLLTLPALVISLGGVLQFLLAVAVIALLVVGLRWLAGVMGLTIPQPMWAILGFILFILLVMFALGTFGSGGVVLR
jgi:hypothetical protein